MGIDRGVREEHHRARRERGVRESARVQIGEGEDRVCGGGESRRKRALRGGAIHEGHVEVHAGAKLMETANSMLKTAMEAKDSKVDRKLKMINLQMQKAKLEHQIDKQEKKSDVNEIDGSGSVVIDRNELLRRISNVKDSSNVDK